MRVLCVGDVVGQPGLDFLSDQLSLVKADTGADFTIVNGENADKSGVGLPRKAAEQLLDYADVVTTGNHCYGRADEQLYLDFPTLLHPANYPYTEDGAGCCLLDTGRLGTLRVINLSGVAFLEAIDSPFARVDALLSKSEARFTIVDFHAESTAEKKALAFYLDGRVSAVFGTHTHVQTADEQVLPRGTGYITDAGMTGPIVSVLGMTAEGAVQRQKMHIPTRFQVAEGPCMLNAVLFELDDKTGLCTGVRRVDHRQGQAAHFL